MDSFGTIKTKILKRLMESYMAENRKDVKEILSLLNENKEFKNLYLFYEQMETTSFDDTESAKIFVDEISNILKEKKPLIESTCKKFSDKLADVEVPINEFYDALDQLINPDSLKNVDKKVKAKKRIVEIMKNTKKNDNVNVGVFTENELMLHTILANNFNAYYNNVLSEQEKEEFKTIISLTEDELSTKTNQLRDELVKKIDNILSEASQSERDILVEKLEAVKKEVDGNEINKLNYYKLKQLVENI